MLKNNRIDDGHFFEFLFLLFLKAKIQTSAFVEFTESFLQCRFLSIGWTMYSAPTN